MKTRIITSCVGIAILVVVMLFFDTVVFDLVIGALCLIGMHEAWGAVGFTKKDWFIFAGAVPMAMFVILAYSFGATGFILPMVMVTALFYAVCLVRLSQTLNFSCLSSFLVFSAVIVFGFSAFIDLKYRLPSAQYKSAAVYFIVLILCYAWGGDTFAYFAGRFFGKHKLAPIVSPKKTVEGAVGGVAGCVFLGIVCTAVYQMVSDGSALFVGSARFEHYILVAVMGGIASVLGILGDLFASVVKRQHGIKDYGTIFPGHGGILDRFDSVMFVAPLVCMAVRYLY